MPGNDQIGDVSGYILGSVGADNHSCGDMGEISIDMASKIDFGPGSGFEGAGLVLQRRVVETDSVGADHGGEAHASLDFLGFLSAVDFGELRH